MAQKHMTKHVNHKTAVIRSPIAITMIKIDKKSDLLLEQQNTRCNNDSDSNNY